MRIAHHWPRLGGTHEMFGDARIDMDWSKWENTTAACSERFPFGTKFILPGGEEFTCLTRRKPAMYPQDDWLDLMIETLPVPYASFVDVEVIYP